MPHIIDLLQKASKEETTPFSFEYYPPKTAVGLENLYNRLWRMSKQGPVFMDVTWGAGGSTSDLTLEMCKNIKELFNVEPNMHLTCTNMPVKVLEDSLKIAKEWGIENIVALRGDPPKGEEKWEVVEGGFACALDLVKHIKKNYGDFFGISVAGYPEGHPNVIKKVEKDQNLSDSEKTRLVVRDGVEYVCSDEDFEKEIAYLKKKVDAGGEIIITQLYYDVKCFAAFVKACRDAGIDAKILPGIMPIANAGGFSRMTGFCKTRVPVDIQSQLDEVKDDKKKFAAKGLEVTINVCKESLKLDGVDALHFYTLNQEKSTYAMMTELGMTVNQDYDEEEKKKFAKKVAEMLKDLKAAEAEKKAKKEEEDKKKKEEEAAKKEQDKKEEQEKKE